jgi:hypothetical protein
LRWGTSIAAPRWPFATLAARSTLAIPTCPRGRGSQGPMLNHRVGQLATQHSVGAREAPRVHQAARLAIILGQPGWPVPARSGHQ